MLGGKIIGGMKGNYTKVTNVSTNDSECNSSSDMDSTSNYLPKIMRKHPQKIRLIIERQPRGSVLNLIRFLHIHVQSR